MLAAPLWNPLWNPLWIPLWNLPYHTPHTCQDVWQDVCGTFQDRLRDHAGRVQGWESVCFLEIIRFDRKMQLISRK